MEAKIIKVEPGLPSIHGFNVRITASVEDVEVMCSTGKLISKDELAEKLKMKYNQHLHKQKMLNIVSIGEIIKI